MSGTFPPEIMSSSSTRPNCDVIDPDIIPPHHPARTLVLCFDGTGDSFDDDNSNIIQLFSMLYKGNRNEQMVYYQPGIGTYRIPEIATPLAAKISRILNEMFAWNLHVHVMQGYDFLMQNYEAGDKICLFGFSRGAYIARALAGMVYKVGLLPSCNYQQVPFAYKLFTRKDETGWRQSTAFKKAFSMDVDIEFIGVWDTVNSVGLIPSRLPFTSSNASIKTFRHALALDERRVKFQANIYNRPTTEEKKLGTRTGDMPKTRTIRLKRKKTQFVPELEFTSQCDTDVLEVWFAGCHTDVGGGSVPNTSRNNLARIPLRWMIRQCFLADTGIRFHKSLLKTVGIDPDALWPVVHGGTLVPHSNLGLKSAVPSISPLHGSSKTPIPVDTTKEPAPTVYMRASMSGTVDTLVDQMAQPETKDKVVSDHDAGTDNVIVDGRTNMDVPLPSGHPLFEEGQEDHLDAHCAIHDQLKIRWFWWILELIPMKQRVQRDDDTWKEYLTINFGRPRIIPRQDSLGIKIHRSVKTRMEADAKDLEGGGGGSKGKDKGRKYVPRAKWTVRPEWVD